MKTSMYNHRQNVFEVQTALRASWSAENTDTCINPDGNYGDETVRAVENAQRFFGIPITGVVDLETWTLLFADFE